MTDDLELARLVKTLRASPDFKVLERLKIRDSFNDLSGSEALVAAVVDTETTGLDSSADEVIELAMLKFTFTRAGKIGSVIETYQSLNEPKNPIPPLITQLTSIDDAAVKGHQISQSEVNNFLDDVVLLIAHNATFDRPFCEQISPKFIDIAWACSATEIAWNVEGVAGARLEYILQSFNIFFQAHRAMDDCRALLEVLSHSLPKSNESVLGVLLDRARRTEARLFALGASYELRGTLRSRGYRWNDGRNGYPRAWFRDVSVDVVETEENFLRKLSSNISPEHFNLTAKNRFRRREDLSQ